MAASQSEVVAGCRSSFEVQWLPAVLELMDSKDFKQVLVPRNPTRSPRAGFIGTAQWVYLNFPQRIERYGFLCGTLAPFRYREQPKNCALQPHRGGTPPDSGWADNEWARAQDTMIIRAAVIVTVALIRFWDRTIPRKLLALRLGPSQQPSVSPNGVRYTAHQPDQIPSIDCWTMQRRSAKPRLT
jgi:hypothetical protein